MRLVGLLYSCCFQLSCTFLAAQEVFIAEVEVLRAELYEKDITIEGEFLSEAAMEEEGISELLVCTSIKE